MLIFKKEKQVRKLFLEHLEEVKQSLEESLSTIDGYLSGDLDLARERVKAVIETETRADAYRGQIRDALLDGAFLPHVRSDIYRLVEAVDSIAGLAESAARFVANQAPGVPDELKPELLNIYSMSMDCFKELRRALKAYFKPKGQLENLHAHAAQVSKLETEVDVAESALSRKIFGSDMELAEKIHLNQLLSRIADIADLAEDAADELVFAAMKSVV